MSCVKARSSTSIGDYRYNDRWGDSSLQHVQQQKKAAQEWLAKLRGAGGLGLSEQEKLSQQLMVRNLKQHIEAVNLKTYEMPIDQFAGAHLQVAQFVAFVPLDSSKHYQDYLSRLHKFPLVFDQIVGIVQQGEKDRLLPPRYLLEKTVDQCKNIAAKSGEENVFGQPVAKFPDAVPHGDRKHLHHQVLRAGGQRSPARVHEARQFSCYRVRG